MMFSAVHGSLNLHVSPKNLSYLKGFSMNKLIISGLVAGAALVSNASAALTAADIDIAGAKADITLVFLAILSVSVLIYGYNKIKGTVK